MAIAASIPGERLPTMDQVGSTPWALTAVAQGIVIASIPLLVVRPHSTIGWAAFGTVAVLATPTAESARPVWAVAALLLTLLALADAVGAARQRVVARSWSRTTLTPACGQIVHGVMVGRRWVPTLVAAGCLLVALVATAWWVHDDLSARAFRTAAHPVEGSVVRVADDRLSAQLRLDTGETIRVGTPASSPAVGDLVVVMTAPGTDRTELLADPFDPTGSLLLGASALLATVVLLREDAQRRRAARRVLVDGGQTLTLVAVPIGGRWLALEPVGAPGRTTSRVRIGWDVSDEYGTGADSDLDGDGLEEPDEGGEEVVDEYAAWVAEQQESVARMTDEELLALGAEQRAERETSDYDRALADAPLVGPTVVEVHGLDAQGDYPVLRIDGRWLITDRPARDAAWDVVVRPLRVLGVRQLLDTRPEHRSAVADQETGPSVTAPRLWRVMVGATGSWLPWLLTPAIGWLAWWLAGTAPWNVVMHLAPVLLLGYSWTTLAQDRLAVSDAGIRVRSAVLSLLVRWPDLARVVADEDSVVLRVVNPPDAILVHQHRDLGRFLPGALTPTDVVRLVEAARPAPGTVRRSPAILLTPGSTLTLAWVAAAVAGAVVA